MLFRSNGRKVLREVRKDSNPDTHAFAACQCKVPSLHVTLINSPQLLFFLYESAYNVMLNKCPLCYVCIPMCPFLNTYKINNIFILLLVEEEKYANDEVIIYYLCFFYLLNFFI